VARLTTRDALPGLPGDHVPVIIRAPFDGGTDAEVDALLPERWAELRDAELQRLVAAALERDAAKRRGVRSGG
jgi:hypothetical protein